MWIRPVLHGSVGPPMRILVEAQIEREATARMDKGAAGSSGCRASDCGNADGAEPSDALRVRKFAACVAYGDFWAN